MFRGSFDRRSVPLDRGASSITKPPTGWWCGAMSRGARDGSEEIMRGAAGRRLQFAWPFGASLLAYAPLEPGVDGLLWLCRDGLPLAAYRSIGTFC
uniref:Uncharacterized protein n=1 Tax=Arundo donax TaxID=35708 RepID=A0A0A9G5Y8_ARUDO